MLINDVHPGDEVTLFHQALEIRPRRLRVDEIVRQTRPGETRAVRQVRVVELDYGTAEVIPAGALVEVPGSLRNEQLSETGQVYLASELTPFAPRQGDYERWHAADRQAVRGASALYDAAGRLVDVHRSTARVTPQGVPMVILVLHAGHAEHLAELLAAITPEG